MRLPIRSLQRFETEAKKAIVELAELCQTHDVTVFCENAGEAQRFGEVLDVSPGRAVDAGADRRRLPASRIRVG